MKFQKLIIASIAICSLAAFNALADAPVMHGSDDVKVTQEKGAGESICTSLPWLCTASTQGNNGGGKELE